MALFEWPSSMTNGNMSSAAISSSLKSTYKLTFHNISTANNMNKNILDVSREVSHEYVIVIHNNYITISNKLYINNHQFRYIYLRDCKWPKGAWVVPKIVNGVQITGLEMIVPEWGPYTNARYNSSSEAENLVCLLAITIVLHLFIKVWLILQSAFNIHCVPKTCKV